MDFVLVGLFSFTALYADTERAMSTSNGIFETKVTLQCGTRINNVCTDPTYTGEILHVSASYLHNVSSTTVCNLDSNRLMHIKEDSAIRYAMMLWRNLI